SDENSPAAATIQSQSFHGIGINGESSLLIALTAVNIRQRSAVNNDLRRYSLESLADSRLVRDIHGVTVVRQNLIPMSGTMFHDSPPDHPICTSDQDPQIC